MQGDEWQFDVLKTTGPGHAKDLVLQVAASTDLLVALGGDGTLNECVNGLMSYAAANPDIQVPALALWPMGSGNDFARNFKWNKSQEEFITRLRAQKYLLADVGCIQYANGEKEFFLNECSMGISSEVVRRVNALPALWNGNLKFGWAIFRTFLSYRKKHVTLSNETINWSGKSLMIVCANGKYLGSGIGLAPDALLNDGLLELTIVGNVSILDYLKHLPQLKRCEKVRHPEISYQRIKSLNIESSTEIEKDGESGKKAPARIFIAENQLRLLG